MFVDRRQRNLIDRPSRLVGAIMIECSSFHVIHRDLTRQAIL